MQNLLSIWFGIDARKRTIAMVSAVAMFAAVIGLSRLATAPTMALLYSGLKPAAAGEIVKVLEARGATYELRGNAIYVETGSRDKLRLALAADGLPANDGQGYELLDNLSGFGTTAQMFDAAYWRAKEGELARTIVASPQYRQARVHISNAPTMPFRADNTASASVVVTGTSGSISPMQANALKYLVSSAVANMSPQDVAVIDGRSGVVVRDDTAGDGAGMGAERAQALKQKIERLLEARVGSGNAVVEVTVDTTTEKETLVERKVDPDTRVTISARKEERSTNSTDTGSGAVTVASNLPQGAGGGGGSSSSTQKDETVETLNYDVSESTRKLARLPGAIRRISVAVLVNEVTTTDPATGETLSKPRSPEELAILHDLVASSFGFDAERGDTLTLKSLPFQPPPEVPPAAGASLMQSLNLDIMRLVQIAVLALVTLVLGLFVIRPILSGQSAGALPAPSSGTGLPDLTAPGAGASSAQPLTGEIAENGGVPSGIPVVGSSDMGQSRIQPAGGPDPVTRLREMIADRQDETVEAIKTWIDGQEEERA